MTRKNKIIPVIILMAFIISLISINAYAGTNVLSYGIRGATSQRSAIGKSSSSATTITITPNYTVEEYNSTVGAIVVTPDPQTPYQDTTVSFEWWTDADIISTRKAYIVLYDGQLGWPYNTNPGDIYVGLDARSFTANNSYKNNSHWTFKNSNSSSAIYTKFKATMTNWSTN